jgi:hypothetical protein
MFGMKIINKLQNCRDLTLYASFILIRTTNNTFLLAVIYQIVEIVGNSALLPLVYSKNFRSLVTFY